MAVQRIKYPRTLHLPWSLGRTLDDKVLRDLAPFEGQEVVVTEKMDGENCTIGKTYTHARSVSSSHHPSRSWVKALQARLQDLVPEGWRLCGENLFAKHSLYYGSLPSYFLLFSIWNEENTCLSWDETVEWAQLFEVDLVPVLYRGPWDEDKIKRIWKGKSAYGEVGEGYVVRRATSFKYEDFGSSVAKFVRAQHVQTEVHWMHREVEPNGLDSSSIGEGEQLVQLG